MNPQKCSFMKFKNTDEVGEGCQFPYSYLYVILGNMKEQKKIFLDQCPKTSLMAPNYLSYLINMP